MLDANHLIALSVLLSDALGNAHGDLSPSAAALLSTLRHFDGSTASELAAVAGIAQPTASRVLDGLARQGFLRRGLKVGRETPLHLTAAGKRRVQALTTAQSTAMARLLDLLPQNHRRTLIAATETLLAEATTSRSFARTTCRHCDHGVCSGSACPVGTRATELDQRDLV
ncbi:MAG: MarR family transcriptional regulator [Thalassobaculaceae bacterium]|nr:MarR family transcriptional regulator [Thalassobaculaceae bacterium]